MKNHKLVHSTVARASNIITSCETFSVGGSRSDVDNTFMIKDCYKHWMLLPLEAVSSRYTIESMETRLIKWAEMLKEVDFNDLVDVLNGLYYALITHDHSKVNTHNKRLAYDWINQWCVETVCGFKGQESPDVVGIMLAVIAPIERELLQFLTQRSITDLRHVVSWLRFPSKLELIREELQEEALCSFLDTEERLAALSLDNVNEIPSLNVILRRWLGTIDFTILPVRHGSGSVAEGNLSKLDKYFSLGIDKCLDKVLNNWITCPKHGYDYYIWNPDHVKWSRTSRVTFVPKNARKLRTICMEPATLQYFQQGVMQVLYDHIRNHRFLKHRIKLSDQTQNQDGACLGSSTNSYATIDLSAASDSVSWDLVRRLFNGTPLLKWMYATRSTHCALPNGLTIQSNKYAPMGSALCFPVECLIFACVVELVAEEQENTTLEGCDSYTFWSVFGDDIVVPGNWYPRIISILNSIGFIVNEEKSYHDGPFRESCGGEYYLGQWITPLYYRVSTPLTEFIDPKTYVQLLASANNALEAGYTFLRSQYLDEALTLGKKAKAGSITSNLVRRYGPCFASTFDTPPIVFSSNPSNFNNQVRWNKGLQRSEVLYLSTGSKAGSQPEYLDDISDRIGYHEYLVRKAYYTSDKTEAKYAYGWDKFLSPRTLVWKRAVYPLV